MLMCTKSPLYFLSLTLARRGKKQRRFILFFGRWKITPAEKRTADGLIKRATVVSNLFDMVD
jgi:hypothetical protein